MTDANDDLMMTDACYELFLMHSCYSFYTSNPCNIFRFCTYFIQSGNSYDNALLQVFE